MMRKAAVLLSLMLGFCQILLWAQATEPEGTAQTGSIADTLSLAPAEEDSMFYSADSLAYNPSLEQIRLFGNTNVRYEEFTISSDSLMVDLKNKRAYSEGDTVMQDGDQILLGADVSYDIDTQTGIMRDGISRMEKSFYSGEHIRKVSGEIYDVDNGTFTTCENAEPDFWFTAKQLRIYRGDKLVGKPVIAYVNHLPVFYFPFVTIPLRRGRHPGFLIPEPGYNNVDGKFLKDIAWYLPIKDYADLVLSMDLYERTGWKAQVSLDYILRYVLNGKFNAAFQRKVTSSQTYNDWTVRANHHQELANKASFDVNVDFVSNKRLWEGSTDIDESLARTVTSSISYRQPLLSSYLNAGASYTENLINDTGTISLPSVSFSLPSRPVYELFYKPDRSPDDWWSNINYNYSFRMDHSGSLNTADRDLMDYIWSNVPDPADSTSYLVRHNAGIRHRLGLSYNWKALGWLGLQHGFTYNEAWYDRDKFDARLVRGNDYSAYTNASFNIYGIRNFPKGWLKSVRHIVTPSAGISFNPDFSDNDRFYSFGDIRLISTGKAANLNLQLDQKWQIKVGKDSRKINDVLGVNSRISANLYKEDKPFGALSHTAFFRPGGFNLGDLKIPGSKFKLEGMSLGYSAQYSIYQDPYKMHLLDWQPTSQYFSQALTLSGSAPYTKYFSKEKNRIFDPYQPRDTMQVWAEEISDVGGQNTWKISIAHDLNAAKRLFDPSSHNLRLDTSFKLTDNWSVSYGNYINLETRELLSQTIHVTRDLHCWKLDLSYTRRNEYWEYRVALFNVALPDALRFQTHDSKSY
jgi:lipopolysaccharide assembly outer membrane protein LptD (OstA)